MSNLMEVEDQEEEMSVAKEVGDMIGSTNVGREEEVGAEIRGDSTEWDDDIEGSETSAKAGGSGIKLKKRRRIVGNSTTLPRSTYWAHFEKFICNVDNIQKAKCKYCAKIIKADSDKHGTKPLINHFGVCKMKPSDDSLMKQVSRGTTREPQLVSWKFDQTKMEQSDTINTSSAPPVVMSPCAACKCLRRRCAENCVLAPYFPPSDLLKFTTLHRVFGARNIITLLQELPETQREDAVSSMVYEANARLRDPVYGCAGAICQLQKDITQLQEQLAKAQAEIILMQCQHANLMAIICMEMTQSPSPPLDFNVGSPSGPEQPPSIHYYLSRV